MKRAISSEEFRNNKRAIRFLLQRIFVTRWFKSKKKSRKILLEESLDGLQYVGLESNYKKSKTEKVIRSILFFWNREIYNCTYCEKSHQIALNIK